MKQKPLKDFTYTKEYIESLDKYKLTFDYKDMRMRLIVCNKGPIEKFISEYEEYKSQKTIRRVLKAEHIMGKIFGKSLMAAAFREKNATINEDLHNLLETRDGESVEGDIFMSVIEDEGE